MTRDPGTTFVALLHHPMRDRTGAVVTTALTTLDLHDIARTCRTYDIAGYFIVHPIEYQRKMAERVTAHWEEDGRHDLRRQALERVSVVDTLEAAVASVTARCGATPRLVATTARNLSGAISFKDFHGIGSPRLLLFGTGFGMTEALLARCDHVLLPLAGRGDYNHLSVRSACAIVLDRLYGDA
jgi:hypothetical protein